MQGVVFALVFLFTSQSVLGAPQNVNPFDFPEDGCFFENKMCDTNAAGKLAPGVESPGDCRAKCIEEVDVNSGKCKTWVFLEVVIGKPECHLLEEACIEVSDTHCTPSSDDESQCASGENPCPTTNVCTKLTSFETDNKAHWHCTSGKSPYIENVAPGDTCFVECSTWTNSVEGEPTSVSSSCQESGEWSAASPGTVMDSADTPVAVGTPADSPNPTCGCNKISIKGGTLNAGTELYEKSSAEGGYEKKDLANTVDIKTGSSYIMFCDRHLALEINCSNGQWSEGITDCTDIYCWDEPASVDECTPSP